MDDALLVRRFEGLCDLPRDRQGVTDGQWSASDEIRQRVSLDQFQDEPRQAVNDLEAVHRGDMRRLERCQEFRFPLPQRGFRSKSSGRAVHRTRTGT